MTRVIVDTSAWVESFHRDQHFDLIAQETDLQILEMV